MEAAAPHGLVDPAALAAARKAACCDAEPPCVLCPLRPENTHRSLAELAAAGLRGNLPLPGPAKAPPVGKASSPPPLGGLQ